MKTVVIVFCLLFVAAFADWYELMPYSDAPEEGSTWNKDI